MGRIRRELKAMEFRRSLSKVSLGGVPQPNTPIGHVVIGCITSGGIHANGKGSKDFLPLFCRTLRNLGWATHFCTSIAQISRTLSRHENSVLINLYGEDHYNIATPEMLAAEQKASVTFNSANSGALIADKKKALTHLTNFGVPMPPPAEPGSAVFSNSRFGCSAKLVEVNQEGSDNDIDRYDRALIDTTRSYRGKDYFTSVRLACIGDKIATTLVRAHEADGSLPVANGTNTTLDPDLLTHLYETLVLNNEAAFQEIATQIHEAIGPSFTGHDLLIERDTNKIYVCETGFKFDNTAARAHLNDILGKVPYMKNFANQQNYVETAASIFSDWCSEKLSLVTQKV